MAEPIFHVQGEEQNRQDVLIGVSVVMTMVGMTFVGMRIYTRGFVVRNMGKEDWTITAAAFLTLVYLFTLIAGSKGFKFGFSGSSLTLAEMKSNLKMLICQGTICLLVTYQFIVICVVVGQCRPLHKLWDFAGTVEGTCINANLFFFMTSVYHVLMDAWILALPIKYFLSIPRPKNEKLALLFVFGLGAFSMIASIVRLQFLRQFTVSKDPFFDALPINLWSMIEINVGILCACLPTLRPLISSSTRHRTREALSKGSSKPNRKVWKRSVLEVAASPRAYSPGSSSLSKKSLKDEEMGEIPPPVPPKDVKVNQSPRRQYWDKELPAVKRDSDFAEVFIKLSQ
ncbi:hypothetical protein BS50DRAFT_551661 [Corynespora cassiicola Philippines]|uniref:Rhodopsin domain-containing protein n=1 Tax=Corynespora cassiicola Philippines TaxID=1448308 RepID=A0A2T2NSJ6_CORCC|nr:hypothetical protein BS50DRAFT_551661 [Corynespora cassiicola Philippines]